LREERKERSRLVQSRRQTSQGMEEKEGGEG